MQILGPAANGKKVKGLLCVPGANLSGLNSRGFFQCFSDRCIVSRGISNLVPEGLYFINDDLIRPAFTKP